MHVAKDNSILGAMGTNSAPSLLADLFLHTFEYDFKVKTMKQDITKAIQFSDTFRYIDDLFSINNADFGNYISAIYPSELQLKATSISSAEDGRHKHQDGRHKHTFPYQHLQPWSKHLGTVMKIKSENALLK